MQSALHDKPKNTILVEGEIWNGRGNDGRVLFLLERLEEDRILSPEELMNFKIAVQGQDLIILCYR
jgi:hypothetical protein